VVVYLTSPMLEVPIDDALDAKAGNANMADSLNWLN
jgi:hypothetical protein